MVAQKPRHIISGLRAAEQRISDLFNHLTHHQSQQEIPETWPVPIDVVEEHDRYIVYAVVPGVEPKDMDISVHENRLDIKGDIKLGEDHEQSEYLLREWVQGHFRRSIQFPALIDLQEAHSSLENGVLVVTLPKHETRRSSRPLKITVKGSGPNGKAR
jgi:HSP20 family protein